MEIDLFKLNGTYSLALEPKDNRLRMVIYRSGVEKVCRLETAKNLEKFIQSDDSHLFKGRLQLHKIGTDITVLVKGELVGIISDSAFTHLLNSSNLAVGK